MCFPVDRRIGQANDPGFLPILFRQETCGYMRGRRGASDELSFVFTAFSGGFAARNAQQANRSRTGDVDSGLQEDFCARCDSILIFYVS